MKLGELINVLDNLPSDLEVTLENNKEIEIVINSKKIILREVTQDEQE